MATKIKNLSVERTEQQENDGWGEVKSFRNKHLLNSDWTQTPDVGLTETNIRRWSDWRKELRRINRSNYATKEEASVALKELARMEPPVEYLDEAVLLNPNYAEFAATSIASKKVQLTRDLNKKFNKALDHASFLTHPLILNEQYEEAVLYLGNPEAPLENYPLIKLEAELVNATFEEVVDSFLKSKRNTLRTIIILKRKFFFFQHAINSATDMIQLDNIDGEMRQWTLTLT